MIVSEELLARYFKGLCTPEEKLLVANYLNDVEDLPEHLLKKEEWDDAEDALMSNEKSEALFLAIKRETISKSVKLRRYKIMAIAAMLLAVLTVGFYMVLKPEATVFNLAKHKIEQKEKQAEIVWKSFVNYTSSNQSITLPDGSSVKVYPAGEIRYAIPFVQQSREIYLTGKSFFKVAKDKKHPFTVYSNGISTTALGTSFTITADDKTELVKVELHTGKVWVKKMVRVLNKQIFSEILMPGEKLVYDKSKDKVNVSTNGLLARVPIKLNEVNFTQVALKDVFEKLKSHYNIKIIYNETDLAEISFTGTINLSQKPEQIIKEITELNELSLTKTANGYIISK
ncbi:FecR family protein [Pedobacter sp. Leaf170]|uniref:FecR family protein n=1 Tax=Pedobacter sp. Leaf170 TaxID=2876558 RepID=UPI001E47DA81|nr:FecR family protein [Pedobacter sp. Leaf170]